MSTRFRSLGVFLAALAAFGGGAFAETLHQVPLYPDADMTRWSGNSVEIGALYTSDDSFKFGEYTGITDKGGYALLNVFWGGALGARSSWSLAASNLGLDSRSAAVNFGAQGAWFVDLDYQALERAQWSDAQFLHDGLGTSVLTLPAAFTGLPGQPPADAALINPFLKTFEIEQGRDTLGVGGGWHFARNWVAEVGWRDLARDGNRIIGAVIGNSGGNPRSVLVPYVIDDKTTQGEAAVRYAGEHWQANFLYTKSDYDSDSTSLQWANPYNTISGWSAAAGFAAGGQGRLELYPDNQYEQWQATAGFDFNKRHRITGTVAFATLTQNEAFLPYTVNPNLVVATPLPRASLDGEIRNTLVDLAYVGRFGKRITLRASVHASEHDNQTPTAQYLYVGGDSLDQDASPVGSGRARVNIPLGGKDTRYRLGVDWAFAPKWIARALVESRKMEYEPAQAELRTETTTDRYEFEIRRTMSELFTGSVRWSTWERTGSDHDNGRPFAASYEPTFVATTIYDNLPSIRQFYVSDYDRDQIRVTGTLTPSDRVTLQLYYDRYAIDHRGPDCGGLNDQVVPGFVLPSQCQGRSAVDGESWTADVQWSPATTWSVYAFYTSSDYVSDQASRQYSGNPPDTAKWPQSTSTNRNWFVNLDYSDKTLGLGLNFRPEGDRFDGGVQYVGNDGRGSTTPTVDPNWTVAATNIPALAAPTAVPDNVARLQSWQAFGRWKLSPAFTLRVNYWYETLDQADWAYDRATATSSNNVILAGQATPNYANNVVAVSLAWTK